MSQMIQTIFDQIEQDAELSAVMQDVRMRDILINALATYEFQQEINQLREGRLYDEWILTVVAGAKLGYTITTLGEQEFHLNRDGQTMNVFVTPEQPFQVAN